MREGEGEKGEGEGKGGGRERVYVGCEIYAPCYVWFLTDLLFFSGSDGLVKIWTVRTNECVATLDQHTEKVHCACMQISICAKGISYINLGGGC